MPAMPRLSGRIRKIAYGVLGKPANITRKSKSKVNQRLTFEESFRVR